MDFFKKKMQRILMRHIREEFRGYNKKIYNTALLKKSRYLLITVILYQKN